ncbi:hypothetical protein LWI28_011338 [Acer negundo]|uniref:ADP-ribosyl cyclase/cyclic ADP-ribose hydrolase n=1 Tax=Acer negundo TaxID=4023 RepID=A0AAD5J5T4_ACENE|nr:hypothetical protein LWI28_011338 [Acer negundo]
MGSILLLTTTDVGVEGTGDDCVSIGSGSRDINVTNVQCGPGHGISIGSLGAGPNEDDVTGVHVTFCNLTNTMYGVRTKTFAKSFQSTFSNIVYDQINPHDVGNLIIIDQQCNPYQNSKERFKESLDKVQEWKDVLRQAANFSGWNSDTIKPESALIEKIVEDILKRLNDMYPSCHDKNLVGIYSRIKQVESFLRRSTGDVGRVGIWGIGGIGKTTLAQAVYDRISCQFEGSCFVESIRETSEQSGESGLNNLRLRLVSALLGEEIACIGAFTSTRLGRKKLLIVFDDVTDIRQVESLTGGLGCPGSGSRIIVTSRDKQVLRNICGEDQIYKAEDLCFNDALKLFCRYAFHQNNPEVDYKELSNGVVEKVGGVPLALKVLGSSLFHKKKEVWESAMQKLENNFDRDIHKVLKISYDGLDDNDQNMFLDITCFFKRWNVDLVKAITDASGFFSVRGISTLINKSLITLSDNYELQMHDLVQAMGKEIVRQESINNPGKRSRLWHHNDIYDILTTDTGTETIVGISLDMSKTSNIHLHPRAFVNMQKLRFLELYDSDYCENNKMYISQSLESVFTQLRYLRWYGCPLKSLQSNFHSKNLVILEMRNSNIEELWSGVQLLDNLKTIDLWGSKHLIRCPDFSGTPNMESLKLGMCESLTVIPQSFQHLNKLESLDVQGCKSITSLPELPNNLKKIDLLCCESLLKIPASFKHLTNLESLELFGCESLSSIPDCKGLVSLGVVYVNRCWKLKMLPEFPNNVRELTLRGIPIEELPSSLEDLCRLEILDLNGCSRLKSLPSSVCKWKSLRSLSLNNCSKIDKFPDDIGTLESLTKIGAAGTAIREVPSSISYLKSLSSLSFSRCKGEDGVGLLLPPLLGFHNLNSLDLSDCGITKLPDNIGCLTSLERLCLDGNNFESIPESIINLSNLKFLDISYCQRIKVLPKFRYWINISAVNCTSLEELSCPSFHNDIFAIDSALHGHNIEANFINCFKLNQNLLNNFVNDTLLNLLNIQGLAASVKRRIYHQVYEGALLSVRMCYPGSEIPECFIIQSSGSSINVNLPPNWSNYNFLCFAFCVVVVIPDPDHQCDQHRDYESGYFEVNYECNIKSKDGDPRSFGNPDSVFWDPYSGPDYTRSNHVFIGFGCLFFRELCDNEFSFQFYVMNSKGSNIEHCKVVKCAVLLMFGQHSETSDECEEEDGQHLEESNKKDEPRQMRLNDKCEEEDEPHPKRLKHIE